VLLRSRPSRRIDRQHQKLGFGDELPFRQFISVSGVRDIANELVCREDPERVQTGQQRLEIAAPHHAPRHLLHQRIKVVGDRVDQSPSFRSARNLSFRRRAAQSHDGLAHRLRRDVD